MGKIYIIVLKEDCGFAPNPYHGFLSIASTKSHLRNAAEVGDWIIGVGDVLHAYGHCIFAAKVTKKVDYQAYWEGEEFQAKKPNLQGTYEELVGDNIYFYDKDGALIQHPKLARRECRNGHFGDIGLDGQSPYVLVSEHFYYFGRMAPDINPLLSEVGYKNAAGFGLKHQHPEKIYQWLDHLPPEHLNQVLGAPHRRSNRWAKAAGKYAPHFRFHLKDRR